MNVGIVIGIVVILFLLVALWFGMRVQRKGDFSFRIKKLIKRTSELVSKVMDFENEADYLSLYENPQDQRVVKNVQEAIGEANEVAVDVKEHLDFLLKRANSWFNFTDLYVNIGVQEEKLEKAEAKFQEAWVKFKQLPKL